jgi:hypothetical protein
MKRKDNMATTGSEEDPVINRNSDLQPPGSGAISPAEHHFVFGYLTPWQKFKKYFLHGTVQSIILSIIMGALWIYVLVSGVQSIGGDVRASEEFVEN